MPRLPRRPSRRRFLALLAAFAVVATATTGIAPRARTASADSIADPNITVTASATSNLTDGQVVNVSVKPAAGVTVSVFALSMKVCTDDVTVANASSEDHCAYYPYSAATDGNYGALYGRPDGSEAFGTIQVGVGTATHTKNVGTPSEVTYNATCDPDHPCRIVVTGAMVTTAGVKTVFDSSTQITFRTDSKISGCSGFDPNALNLETPDRLSSLWANWTVAQCKASASHTAPTRSAFLDEGSAVKGFASGDADVTLSATGYRSPGFDPTTKRAYVATPLALNAVVLAAGGGYVPPASDNWPNNPSNPLPKPYTDLKLTASEAAALVGWGNLQVIPAFGSAMRAENPQLQLAPSLTWPADGSKPLASAATDATTLFATSFFTSQAPDTWKIPSSGPYDSPPGTPRGVDSSFALAKVSFNNVLNTFSGKPALQKFVYSATKLEPTQRYGVYWTLTDLATAKEMGLTPVAIRNAAGKYVLPTAASLAAAVPTMTKQADGTLVPNPASKANPDAYPLSFVEYALAPAAPLVSTAGAERLAAPGRAAASTTPRTASQALLTSWLTYATGAGQSSLPPGFAPLTADLQAQAAKAIAAIGKGTTKPVKTPTKTPTKVPSATGGPLGGSVPLGLGLAGSGGLGSDVGAGLGTDAALAGTTSAAGLSDTGTRAPSSASTGRASHQATIATVHLPPYLGVKAADTLAPLLSLVLLILLTAGATIVTAGRPLPDDDSAEAPS